MSRHTPTKVTQCFYTEDATLLRETENSLIEK